MSLITTLGITEGQLLADMARAQYSGKSRRAAIAERLGPRPHMIELAAVCESYVPSKPYEMFAGVAVIGISGVLSNDPWYGDTSYTSICDALNQANADSLVKAIVLRINSPGGETDGAFETAQLLATVAENKPCLAVADPCAFSAAYLLASQCSEVWAAPSSGGVGSIGVYAGHWDVSGALKQAGMKVTLISAGEGKTDGNPYEPLSDSARADIQANVDRLYGDFVAAVARGMGIAESAVVRLGARLYQGGKAALGSGLADRAGSLGDALVEASKFPTSISAVIRQLGANANLQSGGLMPAIAVHHTATSDGSWDAGANEKRLPSKEAPLVEAHAWKAADGNADAKATYKFPHHEVAENGTVGAANMSGCTSGCGVLNGAMGGADIPAADREGVHAHLAAHLKDGGKDIPALASSAAAAARKEPSPMAETQAAVVVTPTPAEVEAQLASARASGAAEVTAIHELCYTAGKPALAYGYIAKKFTLAQVSADLLKQRVEDSGPETASHILPDAGTSIEAKPSESPVVKLAEARAAEFKATQGGKK
jgi:signal peptide peptidase SppA